MTKMYFSLQLTLLVLYTVYNMSIAGDDASIAQRVWKSMQHHVTNDLQYLLSLATSLECKQKIEDSYIEHISYSVIRKDDSYSFDLQNLCPMVIDKNSSSVSVTHLTLRIVYFIMMYQNPQQVMRLIATLNTSYDVFLVHIDAKSSTNISYAMTQYADLHNNIHLMERQEVIWGGFSIISAQLDAMTYAIQCLKLTFDFFMVLSESDYPLISTAHLKDFLNKHRGKTLMRTLKPLQDKHMIPYLQDVYCECDNALYHVGRRQINEDLCIKMYRSSLWATYDYQFVHYVVHDDDIVPDYIDFFRVTAVSDEIFFATLLMNSPLCNDYADDLKWSSWRLELWPFVNTNKKLKQCKHSHSNTAFCGMGPIYITSEHLAVLQSTNALFARKFNPEIDRNVLNVIDEWRGNKKPSLWRGKMMISVSFMDADNKCLSVVNDGVYGYECGMMDEMQRFVVTQCTEEVYWNNNGCLQNKKQFNGESWFWSICEIRLRSAGDNECLSVTQTRSGIKSGVEIVTNKCVENGVNQKFYFNECRIHYAHPSMSYLRSSDRHLCVGICYENIACLRSCNVTNTVIHTSKLDKNIIRRNN